MLPVERHRFITEVLSQRGRVMVQEVAQLCHISIETARRDLALLERRGLLLRSHGGAVFVEPPAVEKTYVPAEIDQGNLSASAATRRRSRKTRIAKRALEFIAPGDCLLLDSSSTSWFLARQLPDISLVVLTNSLHIIQTLACKANVRTIGLGGEYSAKYEDFIGVLAEQMLKEFVINKLFFSLPRHLSGRRHPREQRAPCAVEAADAAGVGAQVPAGGQQQVRPPLVRAHLPLPGDRYLNHRSAQRRRISSGTGLEQRRRD